MGLRLRFGNGILAGWWAVAGAALGMAPGEAGAQTQGRPPSADSGARTGVEVTALYAGSSGGASISPPAAKSSSRMRTPIGFLLSVPSRPRRPRFELSYSLQGSAVYQKDYWESQKHYLFDATCTTSRSGDSAGSRRTKLMPFGYGTLGADHVRPQGGRLRRRVALLHDLRRGGQVLRLGSLRTPDPVRVLLPSSGAREPCGAGAAVARPR